MHVLGLFGLGMNPGACLVRDGELRAFAEEERFSRQKSAPGAFPGAAAAWCLAHEGLVLDELDAIAFAWDASKYPYRMLAALARPWLRWRGRASDAKGGSTLSTVLANLAQHTPGRLREEIRLGLRAHGLVGRMPPIEFVPHHLSHAASAFYPSPFEEALVLTVDGSGEDVCTQLALGRGDELRVLESIPIPHSLGWFYAAFTAYFGFTPYRDEGKLMGLAALGHARAHANPWPERLERVLRVDARGYEVDPTFTRFGGHTYAERFTDALADYVTSFDPELAPLSPACGADAGAHASRCTEERWVDLAFGVQAQLEAAALALARRAAREHGLADLCIAGGVGLNCKLNGALRASGEFRRVFVQPVCHDAGSAIGAALLVARAHGDRVRHPLEQAYLGPGYAPDALRATLARAKLGYAEPDDLPGAVADELARGALVGWFQGRMEAGPRALGARSILASPLRPDARAHLNREVKGREPWRPFCPSLVDEARERFLVDADDAPFMTVAYQARPELRAELDAVVHVDGSVRPQTVRAEAAPLYHRLLAACGERTGLPLVLNTSFNVAGEPIVRTPAEALRCFYSSGLDALALGPFLLRKT